MDKHAYLIMAHNEFHMLKKLLTELDDERNDIFLHIDKKTKYVDEAQISGWLKHSGITFVPRKKIYWGTYSITDCEIKMLKEAVRGHYSYYHLISGVDFPLKRQEAIHGFFEKADGEYVAGHRNGTDGDDFIYKIKYYFPFLRFLGKDTFEGPGKKLEFMRKFVGFQYKFMLYQEKHGIDRLKKLEGMEFYKGHQWFSITHNLAEYIIQNERKLQKIYHLTNGSDEIAIPTLAMNSVFHDRVKDSELREIDWLRGSPYEYTLDDLEELKNSKAFFARKISYNREPLLVNKIIEHIHDTNNTSEEDPLISVIVPCYNVEAYLKECVDSLLAQTYRNIEIILVDDGATDNTGGIARDYAGRNSNVLYIHRANGGLSAARNTGIDNSKGQYLAFVDSDDYVEPDYIEKLYKSIRENGSDIAVCGYKKEEMETDSVTFDESSVISPYAAMRILSDIFPKENVLLVIAWNKLYRRELFENTRFPEGKIHEDEHTAHRVLGQADSISVITDCLYHYRIREGSITAGRKAQNLKHLDLLDAYKDRIEYSESMMYGELMTYMLYSFFESMKELMVLYTDETIKENKLYSYFQKRAKEIYFRYFTELDSFQKKDYFKLILFPKKYRLSVIRLRDEKNNGQ